MHKLWPREDKINIDFWMVSNIPLTRYFLSIINICHQRTSVFFWELLFSSILHKLISKSIAQALNSRIAVSALQIKHLPFCFLSVCYATLNFHIFLFFLAFCTNMCSTIWTFPASNHMLKWNSTVISIWPGFATFYSNFSVCFNTCIFFLSMKICLWSNYSIPGLDS